MIALLYDTAVVHDQYHVRISYRGKTVGNDEAGLALHKFLESTLYAVFRAKVNGTCCLVKDKHWRIHKHYPGDAYKLLLTLGKSAVLGNYRIIAIRQTLNESVGVDCLCSSDHLLPACVRYTVSDILGNCSGEYPGLLQYHSKTAPETVTGHFRKVPAGNFYTAAVQIVKPQKKVYHGGLSAAGRPYDSDTLTGLRLAGIDGCLVSDEASLNAALQALSERKDVAVILVTRSLSARYPAQIDEMKRDAKTLVSEIPDMADPTVDTESITRYIAAAVGTAV